MVLGEEGGGGSVGGDGERGVVCDECGREGGGSGKGVEGGDKGNEGVGRGRSERVGVGRGVLGDGGN